jgi:hypothetical protein
LAFSHFPFREQDSGNSAPHGSIDGQAGFGGMPCLCQCHRDLCIETQTKSPPLKSVKNGAAGKPSLAT